MPTLTPNPAPTWTHLRPFRNKNPGDLRILPNGEQWEGQVGTDWALGGPFAQFFSLTMGWRALAECLLTYYRIHGLCTVEDICDRWAPPADHNDTSAYTATVAQRMAVEPTTVIQVDDLAVLVDLSAAIALAEGGARIPWDPAVREAGCKLALGVT